MQKLITYLFIALIAFGSMGFPVALHACRSDEQISSTIGFEANSCCDDHDEIEVSTSENTAFHQNSCCVESLSFYKCQLAHHSKFNFDAPFLLDHPSWKLIGLQESITEPTSVGNTTSDKAPPLLRRLALNCIWLI